MLIGINPILGPELLFTLRVMGHGDEIAIVDGNYPASAHGNRVIRADGLNVPAMLEAVLSILPIDHSVDNAIFRAVNSRSPTIPDPVHKEMEQVCASLCPTVPVKTLLADTFYTRVKNAYAIVATSEPRVHANIILRKGVISAHPDTDNILISHSG